MEKMQSTKNHRNNMKLLSYWTYA